MESFDLDPGGVETFSSLVELAFGAVLVVLGLVIAYRKLTEDMTKPGPVAVVVAVAMFIGSGGVCVSMAYFDPISISIGEGSVELDFLRPKARVRLAAEDISAIRVRKTRPKERWGWRVSIDTHDGRSFCLPIYSEQAAARDMAGRIGKGTGVAVQPP